MGSILILNDIETDLNEAGLIGNSNTDLSRLGHEQCLLVAENLHKVVPKIHAISCSTTMYLKKLVHHIRSKSKDGCLLNCNVQYTDSLKERDFGVLSGSRHSLTSSLFSHTRICPERGESVAQCRKRVVSCTIKTCSSKLKDCTLVLSHPFSCQILSNVLLNKDHTLLTTFWQRKGALMRLKFRGPKPHGWRMEYAWNLLDDKRYTEEEVYRGLFAQEGA